MGVLTQLFVKNTLMIESIDTYFSPGMNNFTPTQNDTNMCYGAFAVFKESKITGFGSFHKQYLFALTNLLCCIAWQEYSVHLKNDLTKP